MTDKEIGRELELIAKRLKRARKEKGLTQLELSMQSGVSQNMISAVEMGKRNATFQTIIRLCRSLDIQLSDILKDIEPCAKTDDTTRRNDLKKEIAIQLKKVSELISEL